MSEHAAIDPIGGQAVYEGVMMRGRDRWAVAVRAPDGTILLGEHPLPSWSGRWDHLPVLRGVAALVESMTLGIRALRWSATVKSGGDELRIGPTVAAGLVLAVGVFFVLPAIAARQVFGGGWRFHVAEEGLGIGVLVGYIALLGRLREVRTLFEYHGAEHKVVNAWEAGDGLTAGSVAAGSTRHPRCGTSFLLLVAVVAGIVHTAVGDPDLVGTIVSRVIAIPLVVGVSYELLRFAGRSTNSTVRQLIAPGMALQRLTTREPDGRQLEVAMVALRAAAGVAPDATKGLLATA